MPPLRVEGEVGGGGADGGGAGGGAGGASGGNSFAGGKGVVIIRYKFQ